MTLRALIVFSLVYIPAICFSQMIVTDEYLCIDKPEIVECRPNIESTFVPYKWHMCGANLREMPQGKMLSVADIEKPAAIEIVEVGYNAFYGFVTNHENGTITRINIDEGINSPYSSLNLGNFENLLPKHLQGIDISKYFNGTEYIYYGLVVGGQKEDSKVIRLNFGNDIASTPVADEIDLQGMLDYPIGVEIVSDAQGKYAFVSNYNTSEIVRLNFGNDLANDPVAQVVLQSNDVSKPCGIASYGTNLYITNYDTRSITVADFGSEFSSNPSITTYEARGVLEFPVDITIIYDCGIRYAYITNRYGDIAIAEVDNNGVMSNFESLGNADYLFNPQGISDFVKFDGEIYSLIANIDNSTLSLMKYSTCTHASPQTADDIYQVEVVYDSVGNYNIRLYGQEEDVTGEFACKNVEVVEKPITDIADVVPLVPWDETYLNAGSGYASYEWSTGETSQEIQVTEQGMYYVTVKNEYGCEAYDSIEVKYAGIPNVVTPNGDGMNDTWELNLVELYPETEVALFDKFGNTIAKYNASDYVWDCRNKNGDEVRADTYWYIIDLHDGNKPHKGEVTVLRD